MTTQVYFPNAHKMPCVSSFYMARQPILGRQQDMAGFALQFRGNAQVSSLLPHFVELQIECTLGEMRGFVDVDEAVIMSDVFQKIPRTRFVLNIPETVKASDELMQRIAQLTEQGFVFALDEVLANTDDVCRLLPLVEVVSFDLHKMPIEALIQLTPQVKFANKRLLVRNVETLAQFDACLALGFDYFQGYYFAKPIIEPDKKLAPSQLAIIEVITLISTEADDSEIEERFKRDVSLSLHLLRLVNSAAVGGHHIDSLRQALIVMGRKQLMNWMQVLLYAQPHDNIASVKPLLLLATTRGKLLELLAQRTRVSNRGAGDTAFTVGIMSLMDTLFSMSLEDILEHIAVVDEVRDALLQRKGYFGELLQLAEQSERVELIDKLVPAVQKLNLTSEEFYALQVETFEWSNNVAREAH
ncbi:MAG: EAL domain-containing protein [Burkholderiales bacterium]|nr:EAL domain-containing protein [Burkholderiales bacterium]